MVKSKKTTRVASGKRKPNARVQSVGKKPTKKGRRAVVQSFGALTISGEGGGYKGMVKYVPQNLNALGPIEPIKPYFRTRERTGGVTVNGGEIFSAGVISSTLYTENTIISSTYLSPKYVGSSWLLDTARRYNKYRFKWVKLTWEPNNSLVSSAAAGELMYSFERDVTQREAAGNTIDYPDFFARQDSVAGREYTCFSATYRSDGSDYYYIDDTSDVEPRLSYQAVAYLIAGPGLTSLASGRTFVEYEVDLIEPRASHLAQDVNWYVSNTAGGTPWSVMASQLNWMGAVRQSRSASISLQSIPNDGVYITISQPFIGYVDWYTNVISGTLTATGGGAAAYVTMAGIGTAGPISRVGGVDYSAGTNFTANSLTSQITQVHTRYFISVGSAYVPSRYSVVFSGAGVTNASSVWSIQASAWVPPPLTALSTPLGLVRPPDPNFQLHKKLTEPEDPDRFEEVPESPQSRYEGNAFSGSAAMSSESIHRARSTVNALTIRAPNTRMTL